MDLGIDVSFNRRLFTPYIWMERTYYLLFHRDNMQGPFHIEDAPYVLNNPTFNLGEIKNTDNQVVGNVVYTTSNVECAGSYLIVYSGVFKDFVNKRASSMIDMKLILKTSNLYIFEAKNRATLFVSPMLRKSIRLNLEV